MNSSHSDSADLQRLLPLRPVEFLVLLVLADRERHGYGIVQDIEVASEGSVKLLPGNLYAVLRRLLGTELIRETTRKPAKDLGDKRRRYYQITELGEEVLTAEAARMKHLVDKVEARQPLRADV